MKIYRRWWRSWTSLLTCFCISQGCMVVLYYNATHTTALPHWLATLLAITNFLSTVAIGIGMMDEELKD